MKLCTLHILLYVNICNEEQLANFIHVKFIILQPAI